MRSWSVDHLSIDSVITKEHGAAATDRHDDYNVAVDDDAKDDEDDVHA